MRRGVSSRNADGPRTHAEMPQVRGRVLRTSLHTLLAVVVVCAYTSDADTHVLEYQAAGWNSSSRSIRCRGGLSILDRLELGRQGFNHGDTGLFEPRASCCRCRDVRADDGVDFRRVRPKARLDGPEQGAKEFRALCCAIHDHGIAAPQQPRGRAALPPVRHRLL